MKFLINGWNRFWANYYMEMYDSCLDDKMRSEFLKKSLLFRFRESCK